MAARFFSSVAGASIIIVLMNVLAKGLGFLREILYADAFGLEKAFDLYLVGSTIPLVINIGIFYIGQNFFIPAYNKFTVNASRQEANSFFSSVLFYLLLASLLLTICFLPFLEELLALYVPGVTGQELDTITNITTLYLFSVPVHTMIAIIISYSYTKYDFSLPSFSQLLPNMFIIAAVVLIVSDISVYAIPAGYLTGSILQLLLLLVIVRKDITFAFMPLKKIFVLSGFAFILTFTNEILGQVYSLIDRYFYSSVEQGGIAALNYAYILYMLPISVLSIAFSTAVFPSISEKYHNKQMKDLERVISDGININVFFFIPIIVVIYFFGEAFISLFYERGNFTAEDTGTLFRVLQYLSISLIFFSAHAITAKVMYASENLKVLLIITISAIILKFVLNTLLVQDLGHNGLALGSSATYIFIFISTLLYIRIKGMLSNITLNFREALLSILLGAAALIPVLVISSFFEKSLIMKAAGLLLFFTFYFTIAFLLQLRSVTIIKDMLFSLTGSIKEKINKVKL